MENKQIIIDGVDVSDCIFHSLTTMGYVGYNYCKCFECVCECHNDCYYKQHKRKEQALDEIEKYLDLQQKYFDGEDYHNLLDIINKVKE